MRLIVGLGNPEEKYANTRHNIGFSIAEKLRNEIQDSKSEIPNWKENRKLHAEVVKIGDAILAKPTTFMNESGLAVSSLYVYYNIKNTDLFVIHDDLDLKLGFYKIQLGIGPRDHNGLLSIYEKLGMKDFWHVRIGIDNRTKDDRITGVAYVLQNFSVEESLLKEKVIKNVIDDLIEKINKK